MPLFISIYIAPQKHKVNTSTEDILENILNSQLLILRIAANFPFGQ